jgi:Ser/Thr protein kinase RdoA (MazF antagonist)
MLTRECGTQLREAYAAGAPAPDWEAILPLQAEVQIDLTADVEEALAAGAPDSRPHRLPELLLELDGVEDLASAIERALNGLGDVVPPTVVHEELHEGNVFVRDGRPFFLDWAEACVSHPFVGTLLSLRDATERAGGAERLRDLYLEPFTRFAPMSELREGFWHGYVLGALCRAHTWHRILSPLPHEEQWERGDRVGAWLEILRGLVSGTLRLGDA